MLQEITVRVKSLRHLPQQFFQQERQREIALGRDAAEKHDSLGSRGATRNRRCLRAQANIVNETRETGNSVWGKGMRTREASWLRGADTLEWRLPEQQFKQVKAYTPVCKVHVYAADAGSPSMDTSDSVGWFIVDTRDLAGQRQQERWVKLQGASPAEVLISSSLSVVREQDVRRREQASEPSVEAEVEPREELEREPVADPSRTLARGAETKKVAAPAAPSAVVETEVISKHEEASVELPEQGVVAAAQSRAGVMLATPAAEAVCDLDALPVGPGADGRDARTFSLSISVKGASGLLELSPGVDDPGVGFWFSYSIFGVVVQTDRFERLASRPGEGPILEPMLDSFRLRATLGGLRGFLDEAPPLQVYLCTERRIIANADVDMSLLLPQEDWQHCSASDFGRTGLEGDFELRRPGDTLTQRDDDGGDDGDNNDDARDSSRRGPVVTICAELTRENSSQNDGAQSDAGGKETEIVNRRVDRGVRTWAYNSRARQRRVVITASLRRLRLEPALGGRGALEDGPDDVLVGIRTARDLSPTSAKVTSTEGFRVVACGSRGEVDIEDSALLETINWDWEGSLPADSGGHWDGRSGSEGHSRGALAAVRVLGSGAGRGEVGTGVVPWPSTSLSGQQHVDVKLVSPEGLEVGSCRVCLRLASQGGDGDGDGVPDEQGPETDVSAFSEGEGDQPTVEGAGQTRVATEEEGVGIGGGVRGAVQTQGVQVEEWPLEGERDEAAGRVPRSYRLSVNLASVKDLESAAYVVGCYHYPHFGTSAPVRTSLVWAPPRTDTPLANSCCTFTFGMSFTRLAATVQDRKMVVSIRNKDRFKEEEIGLVTVPLEEVVKCRPQYFRCRDTDKTFTSMAGFRAHVKSRQRAGELSADTAFRNTPVEVKVLDRYLTVASTETPSSSSITGATGQPSRLCSLRVILLLEDLGPTGDPPDKSFMGEELQQPETASPARRPPPASLPQALPSFVPSTLLYGPGVAGPMPARLQELRGELQGVGGNVADLERVWGGWEQWRVKEEAVFAQRLREKDQALEDKWEARESARRRDVSHAQTDYAKLEGKLRKALAEVEARERALKAREESWRSEHAQKLSELQLLQRRLREESKHQVDLERMKVKALEKQLASQTKSLEDARARVVSTDEDLERFRQQQRRTPEGGLRQEVFRLGAAKAEAEAQVEREKGLKNKALLEKEEYRAHIHKLARALKRHQDRESTCARREMEHLRLEYLAREERFMLDGDRNELRTIKQELDELRHVSLVQEAQAGLAKANNSTNAGAPAVEKPSTSGALNAAPSMGAFPETGPSPSPPPRPTPAPAPAQVSSARWEGVSGSKWSGHRVAVSREDDVSRGTSNSSADAAPRGGSGESGEEMERLVEWRDELLGTGMYTAQNPIVSELNRRIQVARMRGGLGVRLPREE